MYRIRIRSNGQAQLKTFRSRKTFFRWLNKVFGAMEYFGLRPRPFNDARVYAKAVDGSWYRFSLRNYLSVQ